MKTQTVTVQIGNSDDKLTQQEWANFVNDVRSKIVQAAEVHFAGGSVPDARWQNYCWVVCIECDLIEPLKRTLAVSGRNYRQEAVAFTVGETLFL